MSDGLSGLCFLPVCATSDNNLISIWVKAGSTEQQCVCQDHLISHKILTEREEEIKCPKEEINTAQPNKTLNAKEGGNDSRFKQVIPFLCVCVCPN